MDDFDTRSETEGGDAFWLWVLGAAGLAAIALSIWSKTKVPASKRQNAAGMTAEVVDDHHRGLLPYGHVSSPFGMRTLPGQAPKMHQGVDISAPKGTPVRAAQAGLVTDLSKNGERQNYGNAIILEHTDGTATMYAHLDHFYPGLRVGDVVQQGQVIGYVGTTELPRDESTMQPHLHFEAHEKRVLDQHGRSIVNPEQPTRYEPLAYLLSLGRTAIDETVADAIS